MTSRFGQVRSAQQHVFETLIGHDSAKIYLRNAVEMSALPHALLIHGPQGVGKLSLAYALAKYINCASQAPTNCSCSVCRKIASDAFADILIVEPRGAAGQITLAGWKAGRDESDGDPAYYRFIDTAPLEGVRKVLIIRQAERMNLALANFLLKLIEEPPSYLQIILITDRPGEILPTIRSRCAPVKLCPLNGAEMTQFVSAVAPDLAERNRALLLRLSAGSPGRLLEMLSTDPAKEQDAVAKEMNLFLENGFPALFRVARNLAGIGEQRGGGSADALTHTLNAMLAWFRDAMLAKVVCPTAFQRLSLHIEADTFGRFASGTSLEGLAEAFLATQQMAEYVPRQTDRQYVLELALSRIGRALRAR
ncbi:MAG: hypothetical protein D6691_09015 [Candidatus Hydrogenedentota bacterium]|jgi:DNA polymerase-3 subunit delta'|uniref:DNA polymerase III delta prime subunit n=1 Tax=Sumerlaea chitinivorans TaxID=2250252 RepID=A0A2Z4Y281_SUMC1|nr:DNA polymerase III delta prime subunit [Candidatus Sumerlaea chitinivorans]RMH25912.1 MAG: hypothetical protein D6691_09015 [Candidatus Hydrogenedentota bacterium]